MIEIGPVDTRNRVQDIQKSSPRPPVIESKTASNLREINLLSGHLSSALFQ